MKVTIEQFFKDAFSISLFGPSWIHNSYRQLIEFFQNCDEITNHEFIIGAYFTYGWMPAMLHLEDDTSNAVKIVNTAKIGNIISDNDMESLACAVNGSFVGASKLLHFINPRVYAIWDSGVYRYLYGEPPYQYKLESMTKYKEHLSFINKIEENARCEQLLDKISRKIGYTITSKRAVELVMYLKGAK